MAEPRQEGAPAPELEEQLSPLQRIEQASKRYSSSIAEEGEKQRQLAVSMRIIGKAELLTRFAERYPQDPLSAKIWRTINEVGDFSVRKSKEIEEEVRGADRNLLYGRYENSMVAAENMDINPLVKEVEAKLKEADSKTLFKEGK